MWSPWGTGAVAKAPQHMTPSPASVHSHELHTEELQTHPGAQRRQESFVQKTTQEILAVSWL